MPGGLARAPGGPPRDRGSDTDLRSMRQRRGRAGRTADAVMRLHLSISSLCLCVFATGGGEAADPYAKGAPPKSTQDTADEPVRASFSLEAAAGYLDRRAHLSENHCYACHSTFTYLPARSLIDPLAPEVMRTRVMLERLLTKLHDPEQAPTVKTQHVSRVRLLAAVELARHDAATTGRLDPVTRRGLDHLWERQNAAGGIDWIHVREAPQAIDDWWPAAMIALGVAAAPEDYASTEAAKAGLEKLRGWFRSQTAKTRHERALTLLADSAIGGILDEAPRARCIGSIRSGQRGDGGWGMADLAPWRRKDKKPLDPARSDGYATALCVYALARSGIDPADPGLRKGIDWLKTNQRETGGWFTQSPFARDKLASNTGTSFAIQALAAGGELPPPPAVEAAAFAEAKARAETELPPDRYLPVAD